MTIKRRPELQMMHARVGKFLYYCNDLRLTVTHNPALFFCKEKGGIELSDESYCLLGVDLREWDQVVTQLLEYGLDTQ